MRQGSRAHLIHVRVEEAIAEADRGRFVRVAVGQLHVHAPASAVVRACSVAGCNYVGGRWHAGQASGRGERTVFGAVEDDVDIARVIVHQGHLIVGHHPGARQGAHPSKAPNERRD